jgi:uncharacterized membrane protein
MNSDTLPSETPAEAPAPEPASAGHTPSESPSSGSFLGRRRLRRTRPEITQLSGEDLGRIVSLSDGVFAFAMTLLVLSLIVPTFSSSPTERQLVGALTGDWPKFLGFVFAFVMIAIWWVVHNRTYQYIARFDSGLVWLNMILLMQIAVMPFVLSFYISYTSYQVAIDLFAAIQITLGMTTTLTWEYAQRRHLSKPNTPPAAARYFTRRGYYTAAVFAVSIGVSFVNLDAAQICWIGIFFVQRALTIEGD